MEYLCIPCYESYEAERICIENKYCYLHVIVANEDLPVSTVLTKEKVAARRVSKLDAHSLTLPPTDFQKSKV